MDTINNFLGGGGGAGLGSVLGTAAQMYGQQNAAEAVNKANTAAAGTQADYLKTASGYFNPYLSAGAGASSALSKAEGTGGAAPDYSGFENMPGYKFAIQQGTQAIQRQAAAQGNAYTPNEAQAVGQYVTGTAMQDYNTYISQLQATAGMGATAAGQIGNITYNTGANISQLQANTGQSQAGMYTGMGQTLGGAMNGSGGGGLAGALGGAGGGAGGLFGAFGNIAKGIGSMFSGNGGTNPDGSPNGGAPGMVYDNSSGGYYDPQTGTYYMPNDNGNGYYSVDANGGGGDSGGGDSGSTDVSYDDGSGGDY